MHAPLPPRWAGFRWEATYTSLPPTLFRAQNPTPVPHPSLIVANERLAASLGLDVAALTSPEGVAFLAGNGAVEGVQPIAQAYAGHQFGHFTILGDGRALLAGEHRAPHGVLVDIVWKGSGRTPFSRGGDGRLALGPALREYLISEAMAALRIPTTRSLAVVATGESIVREERLPGAVLLRVASSHLRVGTFQFALIQQEAGLLQALTEYAMQRNGFVPAAGASPTERVRAFFADVIDRQAKLVASWMSVGFVHGVMNTDNTTISGETIDFGPCAFLDTYASAEVFSSIDLRGRYAFGQQPEIAAWNLARLGDTLVPLLGATNDAGVQAANEVLTTYGERFSTHLLAAFGAKLGITTPRDDDGALLQELLTIAEREKLDFHFLWITLTDAVEKLFESDDLTMLAEPLRAWVPRWLTRLREEQNDAGVVANRMRAANPRLIPRNHRVEEALEAAQNGDDKPFRRLLAAVQTPFADNAETRELGAAPAHVDPTYRTFCGT